MCKLKLLMAWGMFCSLISLSGCASRSSLPKAEKMPERLVGSDKDKHGCLASAGYQWSGLLKDCIRPFEKGVKLAAKTEEFSSMAAYLVFNADSSKVEVYMPKTKVRPVLNRKVSEGKETWSDRKYKHLAVNRAEGRWAIYEDSSIVFLQD